MTVATKICRDEVLAEIDALNSRISHLQRSVALSWNAKLTTHMSIHSRRALIKVEQEIRSVQNGFPNLAPKT